MLLLVHINLQSFYNQINLIGGSKKYCYAKSFGEFTFKDADAVIRAI